MTRDDLAFLIEKATGMVLLVIGLGALPQLIDVWIGGVGPEDPSTREAALHVLIPLAAAAFLLMRRTPRATAAVAPATPSAATMTREDWLWVGCKIVGAFALLHGLAGLAVSVAWSATSFGAFESGPMLGSIVGCAIQVAGGAWLLFGDRVWRLACRQDPRSS